LAECDFRVGLDQPLAAGDLRPQHLIHQATGDILNAAQNQTASRISIDSEPDHAATGIARKTRPRPRQATMTSPTLDASIAR
jgi:hypothetical protein